ncbi:hypothetical protein [Nocardia takedensis]|uniref:hypothetical protein n=1 Tax=Nocardia takedensis TaxID=259390 RepID=UPI000315D9AF|nr:hypothetical protein [Nocardia takedensis]
MLSGCHGPAEVAYLYRRLGFEKVSCAYGRVSLVASPRVGAVVVPQAFAEAVKHRVLASKGRDSVPILTHGSRHDRNWVFLVGPAWGGRCARRTLVRLAENGVRLVDAGQRIWLPMNDNSMGWHWLTPPVKGVPLPLRTTVISAAHDHLERPRVEWADV